MNVRDTFCEVLRAHGITLVIDDLHELNSPDAPTEATA